MNERFQGSSDIQVEVARMATFEPINYIEEGHFDKDTFCMDVLEYLRLCFEDFEDIKVEIMIGGN